MRLSEIQKQELNKILDMLYLLEDKTEYKNKNIGNAINLLQKEL